MAAYAYTAPTNSQVNAVWRSVQGPLSEMINFEVEEFDNLDTFDKEQSAWSLRSVTFPGDIIEGGNVATIPEGGSEGIPFSPNALDFTLTPVNYNVRFAASKLAMFADKNGGDNQIKNELMFRGSHAIRALSRAVGDDFWGFSTGILALTDTDITASVAATITITLKSAYGVSGITDVAYISRMFKPSEWVAILDSGTRRTTARVVSIATTGVMVLDSFDTALTTTTNGLQIVRANAVEQTQTSYNRGLVGMLDGLTTASVQGQTSATYPNWSVAYSDTAAGRFTGTKMHIAKDEINNYGVGAADTCWIAQGVYRDLVSQMQSSYRASDPLSLQIDGAAKSKGIQFVSTRRTPPGYVVVGRKKSLQRWQLNPKPGKSFSWKDGKEKIDESVLLFSADFPLQLAWKSRKSFAYFSGQTSV
jgi:hypothetical protein